jgi:prepilin-type N-terminal cleavage/methylation domain-containing protein
MRLRNNRRKTSISLSYVPLADKSGFTLLETMIAMVILVIGVAGVMQSFAASMAANREANANSTAAMLANQVASQLDNQSSSVDAGTVQGAFDDAPGYSYTAVIGSADSTNIRQVQIAVNWQQGNSLREYDLIIDLQVPTTSSSTSTTSTGGG